MAWCRGMAVVAVVAGATACASGRTMEASGGDVSPETGASAAQIQLVTTSALFADANIAAMGSAANQEEIQTSRLALEKAQDANVKAFAQRMIDEHSRVEQQMGQMLSAKGMAPMDNAFSAQLKRNLPPKLEMLRGMSGRDFDMAYVENQVAAHQTTLLTLDTTMIPECDDPEMKAFLQNTVRPAVVMHLQQVKQIHDQLMMGH